MMPTGGLFGDGKRLAALGIGIIAITNIVALAGVAYNRSGEPQSVVMLSERELDLPYRYGFLEENTGIQLAIKCRTDETSGHAYVHSGCNGTPAWLERAKLIELGFRLPQADDVARRGGFRNERPREVHLVLEFNGAAHNRALVGSEEHFNKQQKMLTADPGNKDLANSVLQARRNLDGEQRSFSRLFAIDASRDKAALRAAYADTRRYIFVKALVRPMLRGGPDENEWKGVITGLLVDQINIPLEHRALFEPLEMGRSWNDGEHPLPRFEVQVAFGKRAEPWVIAARKL